MKKTLLIFVLTTFFFATLAQNKGTVKIKAIFPFTPSEVTFHGYWPNQTFLMEQTGPNEFEVLANLSGDNKLIFNISYNLPSLGLNSLWIASGNLYNNEMIPHRLDAHGLKSAKVYINNQLISSLFTIKNREGNGLDISIQLDQFNGIKPFIDETHQHVNTDDRIPAEVHHHKTYLNINYPLSIDNSITGWIVALADNNMLDQSTIEVDYLRVYGFLNSDSILLCNHEYNSFDQINDGGLYMRYPYFPAGFDEHDPFPATINQGNVVFMPSIIRDKVWHLWTERHTSLTGFYYDGYKVHCKARTTGHAVIQVGIDFRDTEGNIHELGVSDWFFHNNGEWQEIVFDSRSLVVSTSINDISKGLVSLGFDTFSNIVNVYYKNVIPGLYALKLFSTDGSLEYYKEVKVNSSCGNIEIPVEKLMAAINLFSFKSSNSSYSGKVSLIIKQ